jgi:hypothetical protein
MVADVRTWTSRLRVASLSWLPLFAFFFVLAWVTTPATYALRDLALLAALYLALAVCTSELTVALAHALGRAWLLASLPLAFLLTWHLRECVRWPEQHLGFALFLLALAGCLTPLVRRMRRVSSLASSLSFAAGGAAAFALIAISTYSLNTFRWHVLHHNTTLGTPLYYALSTSTEEVIERVWRVPEPGAEHVNQPLFVEPSAPGSKPPNLVLILVDCFRADLLQAFGAPQARFPNLEAFTRDGFSFVDVAANASWTRASVASMITGLVQEHHGAADRTDSLAPGVQTLMEQLKQRGYQTAGFVANFPAVGPPTKLERGFDDFFPMSVPGEPYAPAEFVNGRVKSWLEARRAAQRTEPLYLYVHYLDPHMPYRAMRPKSSRPEHLREAYEADVAYFDRQFAVALRDIESLLDAKPVFIVTADHGEEFGEHGVTGHGSGLSAEQLHIPLIVGGAGIQSGMSRLSLEGRDLFSLVDYLSAGNTNLVDWAVRHGRMSRYSSVYLAVTPSKLHPRDAKVGKRSYSEDGRLLVWSAFGETFELYDLADDPQRRNNIYDFDRRGLETLQKGMLRPSRTAAQRDGGRDLMVDAETLEALRALGYAE